MKRIKRQLDPENMLSRADSCVTDNLMDIRLEAATARRFGLSGRWRA